MSNSIFKAYDVRGKYPDEINERVVAEIVRVLAKKSDGNIVVAHDARLSSRVLYSAVIKSLLRLRSPNKIIKIGLATTPMFYFLVSHYRASLGVMVTASHNPKVFNGLKAVRFHAVPISGTELKALMAGSGRK